MISTLTTYFNKKIPTLRRFTKSESDFRFVQFFFIHPVVRIIFIYAIYIYVLTIQGVSKKSLQLENSR